MSTTHGPETYHIHCAKDGRIAICQDSDWREIAYLDSIAEAYDIMSTLNARGGAL
jgi:hypothetical protein